MASKVFNRSLRSQIGYLVEVERLAEENPDLTYEFIKDILVAEQEKLVGRLEVYKFGVIVKLT